jgi:hypothetical protein
VTLAEANKAYTPVPIQENAAVDFSEHFYLVKSGTNESKLPLVGRGKWPKPPQSLDEETKKRVARFLAENAKGIAIIHAAMQLPKSRYPIDLEMGPSTRLPHLSKIREAENLLQLKAVYETGNGNQAAAVEALLDHLRLENTLRNEPVMISQFVRLAGIQSAVGSAERILSGAVLSTNQIDSLTAAFTEAEESLADCWERMILDERTTGIALFGMPLSEVTDLMDLNQSGPIGMTVLGVRKVAGLWDADLLFYLKILSRAEKLGQRTFADALKESDEINATVMRTDATHMISRRLLPDFGNAFTKLADARALLGSGKIALALEEYRINTGSLPGDLQALVPGYLKVMPLDPATEKPFRYTRTENGYAIASELTKPHQPARPNGVKQPEKITFTVERRLR